MGSKCVYIKPTGERCNANAMTGSEYCFFHAPEMEQERQEARANGGRTRRVIIDNPLPPVAITDARDIISLLNDTINRVRAGEMDVRVANCLGVLCGHLLKAFEVVQLKDKVEFIERVLEG